MLLIFQSQMKLSCFLYLTLNTDHIKRYQGRGTPDKLSPPITGHYYQDPQVRRATGLSSARYQSRDLMTQLLKTSQTQWLQNVPRVQSLRCPISQNQARQPWGRKLGASTQTGSKERELASVPLGTPVCDHTSRRGKTQLDPMVSQKTLMWFSSGRTLIRWSRTVWERPTVVLRRQ